MKYHKICEYVFCLCLTFYSRSKPENVLTTSQALNKGALKARGAKIGFTESILYYGAGSLWLEHECHLLQNIANFLVDINRIEYLIQQ